MYMYVYLCIYINVYTCIYTNAFIIHIYIHIHIYTCIYVCIYINIYIHIYIYTPQSFFVFDSETTDNSYITLLDIYIHTHTHTHTQIHIHTYLTHIHTSIQYPQYTCIHICIHTSRTSLVFDSEGAAMLSIGLFKVNLTCTPVSSAYF